MPNTTSPASPAPESQHQGLPLPRVPQHCWCPGSPVPQLPFPSFGVLKQARSPDSGELQHKRTGDLESRERPPAAKPDAEPYLPAEHGPRQQQTILQEKLIASKDQNKRSLQVSLLFHKHTFHLQQSFFRYLKDVSTNTWLGDNISINQILPCKKCTESHWEYQDSNVHFINWFIKTQLAAEYAKDLLHPINKVYICLIPYWKIYALKFGGWMYFCG